MASAKPHRRISLRHGITYFHIGVAVIFSFAILAVSYPFLDKTIDYFQKRIIRHQVQKVQGVIENHLTLSLKFLEDYARFPILVQGVMHVENLQPLLIDFMKNMAIAGTYPQLVLLDYKNRIIHTTLETPQFNYDQDKTFGVLSDNMKPNTSVNRLDNECYWRLAVPVVYNGHTEGRLVAELPITSINTNHIISKGLNNLSLEFLHDTDTCFSLGTVSSHGLLDYQLPDYGLTLRFGFDSTSYEHERNNVIAKLIAWIVFIICILLFATRKITRRFIEQPILALREYSTALASDSHRPSLPTSAIVEIAHLANDFEVMAGKISTREKSLREAHDTLEVKIQERTKELLQSEERLELAIQGADLGLWDWNIQTGDVFFNERWATMLGYQLDEIEPKVSTWEKLVHPDDMEKVMKTLEKHLEGETPIYQTEHRMLTKAGTWKWILDTGKVCERDEEGKPFRASGTHLDIDERKQAEEKIRHMANHDGLTGLPNRALFMDRLETALKSAHRSGTSIAVFFIDLDGFKSVNDQLGHEAGDLLLKMVAQRLQDCVRASDTVGRFGGDEFVVLLTGIAVKDSAKPAAEKIIFTLREPFVLEDKKANIGCSIGISTYPTIATTPEELIAKADNAMYRVKNAGKNDYSFAD